MRVSLGGGAGAAGLGAAGVCARAGGAWAVGYRGCAGALGGSGRGAGAGARSVRGGASVRALDSTGGRRLGLVWIGWSCRANGGGVGLGVRRGAGLETVLAGGGETLRSTKRTFSLSRVTGGGSAGAAPCIKALKKLGKSRRCASRLKARQPQKSLTYPPPRWRWKSRRYPRRAAGSWRSPRSGGAPPCPR